MKSTGSCSAIINWKAQVFIWTRLLKKSTNKLYTEDVYSAIRPSVGSVQLKVTNVKLATRTSIEFQKKNDTNERPLTYF